MAHLVQIRDDFAPKFYEAIGKLAIAFGRIEYLLQLVVKDYHGRGFEAGLAKAKSQNFSRLLEFAEKEFNKSVQDPTERTTFKAFLDRAGNLSDDRNDMLHALWTSDANGDAFRYRVQLDRGAGTIDWAKSRVVKVEEIEKLTAEVVVLRDQIHAWRQARGYGAPIQATLKTEFSVMPTTFRKP